MKATAIPQLTTMKQAVLLPNMVGFPSESMKRYGDELFAALRRLNAPQWAFEAMDCEPVKAACRLIPGEQGIKLASRLGRLVRYPRRASARAAVADPRADVFHILDHSHANLTLALPGNRTVLTCHDIIPFLAAKGILPMPSGRATKITFPLRIRCMKRCRRLIAVSESTKRDLINHAGVLGDRIDVVYNGLNAIFGPAPEGDNETKGSGDGGRGGELLRAYGMPSDARVMLHVGTATRYKNTPIIIRALARLNRESSLGGKLYLLRVGAPFFEDENALIDSLDIRDRIVHAGRVHGDALLADHYRAADVFVFPSLWEGFGWPPLEAMACGTPVVTSNVASLPEIVGDAGITVPPDDLDAFAGAIHRILTDDGLRAELSAKALVRASRFTWEQCARDTLAVYERVTAT